MPITFSTLASIVSNGWKGANALHSWATNAPLRREFEIYLRELENRRVLYTAWEYENVHGVLASLEEILQATRSFRAHPSQERDLQELLGKFIRVLQEQTDIIRGCNTHTPQGEFMAYKALLTIRSEMARTLAILCGALSVDPGNYELEQFIMNMALVKPKA